MHDTRKTSMNKKPEKEKQKSNLPLQERTQGGERPVEIGGPKGPEPTRYGDWERRGRCIDF